LSDKLERVGCIVQYAMRDADTLIAMSAVKYCEFVDTLLVREDTDLLVSALLSCKESANGNLLSTRTKVAFKKRQSMGHKKEEEYPKGDYM